MISKSIRLQTVTTSALAALLLSGCDSVRNTFGLDHYQADEFSITENAPLSLPPSYTLLPPEEGKKAQEKPAVDPAAAQAQDLLLGKASKTSKITKSKSSAATNAVISKAATDGQADENIRTALDNEADKLNESGELGEKVSNIGATILKNMKRTSNDSEDTAKTTGTAKTGDAATPLQKK